MKAAGGVVGLILDPDTRRRWNFAGPEICRLRSEFSRKDDEKSDLGDTHHERYESFQRKVAKQTYLVEASFLEWRIVLTLIPHSS